MRSRGKVHHTQVCLSLVSCCWKILHTLLYMCERERIAAKRSITHTLFLNRTLVTLVIGPLLCLNHPWISFPLTPPLPPFLELEGLSSSVGLVCTHSSASSTSSLSLSKFFLIREKFWMSSADTSSWTWRHERRRRHEYQCEVNKTRSC